MKLTVTGMKMWTHLDCTCKVMCMNGVWMWRSEKITGTGMDNGIAFTEKEAIELAEQASAKLNSRKP